MKNFLVFKTLTVPVCDILDLVICSENVSINTGEVQVDRSVPITLSLDPKKVIEQVLGKVKDDEEEEKEDNKEVKMKTTKYCRLQ